MKNVLFATTAIVAFGGAAFADGHEGAPISFSGSAELGVTYTDADGAANDGVDFVGDYGIDITATGTSDAGITFGANLEVEAPADEIDDFNVFVSGAFGTLTLGDIDSAYDKVSIGIDTGGLADEADFYAYDSGFDGATDSQFILRYDYTVSGVTLSGSVEQGGAADDIYSVGLGYDGSFGGVDVGLGLGYSDFGDGSIYGVGVSAGFSSITVKASYQIAEDAPINFDSDAVAPTIVGDTDFIQASVAYAAGAITVGANVHVTTGDFESENFGAFAEYDLGGGLSVVGALSVTDFNSVAAGLPDEDEFQAGIGFAMSF